MRRATTGAGGCLVVVFAAVLGATVLSVAGAISSYRAEVQAGGSSCPELSIVDCAQGDAFFSLLVWIPIGAVVGAALGLLALLIIRRRAGSGPLPTAEAGSRDGGSWPPPPNRPAV